MLRIFQIQIYKMNQQDHTLLKQKKTLREKNMDWYKNTSTSYAEFVFQDFESYRRTRGIPQNDIKMILKQQISNFIPYDIPPGIYSITDILYYVEKVSKGGLQIKDVDISKKKRI